MNYFTEKLTKIQTATGCRVRVEFRDGFTADLDLSPLIEEGPIFAPLRDPATFAAVRLERGAPIWSDSLDLAPGSLRAWAESGRVLSVEETDAWVAENSTHEESNLPFVAHR